MGYARSDGFSRSRDGHLNTGYSGSKAFYQGAYRDSIVNMSWHLGITDKGWGSGTFYATPRWQADEQYEHTTKLFPPCKARTEKVLSASSRLSIGTKTATAMKAIADGRISCSIIITSVIYMA